MKKVLTAILAMTMASTALADTLLGGDVEINAWQQNHTINKNDEGDNTSVTFEASLEHPIPLIPNFKVGQSEVDAESIVYTKQDYSLYYEFLDNGLISADAGFGVSLFVDGELDTNLTDPEGFEGFVPHLYASVEVGIPATPLAFFVKGNGISYEDNDMIDYSVGAKFTIPVGLIDFDLQAGYRSQTLTLKGFDDLNVDIESEVDGFFAGINVDF